MKSRLRPATGAIVGRRAEQQDAVLAEPVLGDDGTPGLLLVVADGMGGHAGGQVASRIAVETFAGAWRMGGRLPPRERLRAALDIANRAIGANVLEQPHLRGMGCTLVAALIFGNEVQWISVGDSLLLAIGDGQLTRLNADHSLAPEIDRAVLAGRVSQADADADPDRHVLLSALSGQPINMIDDGQRRLAVGAFVLLATDGLLTLPMSRVAELGSGPLSAERKVAALLAAVEDAMADDQDNTSLAAVHCAHSRRARGKARRWRRALGLLLLLLGLAAAACAAWLLRDGEEVVNPGEAPTVARPAQTSRKLEGVGVNRPTIQPMTPPRARQAAPPRRGKPPAAERTERTQARGETARGTAAPGRASPPAPRRDGPAAAPPGDDDVGRAGDRPSDSAR